MHPISLLSGTHNRLPSHPDLAQIAGPRLEVTDIGTMNEQTVKSLRPEKASGLRCYWDRDHEKCCKKVTTAD